MTVVEVETRSAAETEALGAVIGASLRAGDVISLSGPLGSGKTVLVRGLAIGLGLDPVSVRSPTFVFHHVYGRPPQLHHVDLYRLGAGADVAFLDLESLAAEAPLAIEWGGYADLATWAPVEVTIEPGEGDERRIRLRGNHPAVQGAAGR